jgi:hypothetical protein
MERAMRQGGEGRLLVRCATIQQEIHFTASPHVG